MLTRLRTRARGRSQARALIRQRPGARCPQCGGRRWRTRIVVFRPHGFAGVIKVTCRPCGALWIEQGIKP